MIDLNKAQVSDYSNQVKDFEIKPIHQDSHTEQKETEWQNTDWIIQWGHFNEVPELKSALTLKATWITGKGYTTDNETQTILDNITGWGKDTFEDIIFNAEVTKRIGGDAYAEIIRDDEGILVNLKPLDPSSIKIIVDDKGIIKRYEQVNKVKGVPNKTFSVWEIFHLSHNRLADQIHGISDIDVIKKVLQADGESFEDLKKISHRGARPLILWKLKTDDQVKIANFVRKVESARNLGEDMFIPDDEDIATYEIVEVNIPTGIMEWRNDLRNKFYRVIGLPQIVPGAGGQSTESESKVIYLAFEQLVEKDQRTLERQIKEQLFLDINFIPPSTLSNDLQTDNAKDGNAFQSSDTQAGVGR